MSKLHHSDYPALAGRTVSSARWSNDGSLTIGFTDGTRAEFGLSLGLVFVTPDAVSVPRASNRGRETLTGQETRGRTTTRMVRSSGRGRVLSFPNPKAGA